MGFDLFPLFESDTLNRHQIFDAPERSVLFAVGNDLLRQTRTDSGQLLEVIRCGFVDVDCRRLGLGGLPLTLESGQPTIARHTPQHDYQHEDATEVPEQFPNLALTNHKPLGPIIVTPSMPIFGSFGEFTHLLTPQEKANRVGKKVPPGVKGSLPGKLFARFTDHRGGGSAKVIPTRDSKHRKVKCPGSTINQT
jgi:hypothetical protein